MKTSQSQRRIFPLRCVHCLGDDGQPPKGHPQIKHHLRDITGTWATNNTWNSLLNVFPHIQGFKSNQGSHVILVALICSINIEPLRKNRESKKLNLALGLRVTSNSATLKFTREEPPSGLLTLRMPEPTVDPTNYWNQSRPMILRQNIPEFYQVRFAMDPTLSNISLRWILLCSKSPKLFETSPWFPISLTWSALRWIWVGPIAN